MDKRGAETGPAADRQNIWVAAFIAALLVVMTLAMFSKNLADPDLWGYLAFGRLFWESGGFPYHDIFTYVPTKEIWVYHEWLTGVLFYPLYLVAGNAGLQSLKILLGLSTLALIWATARRRGAEIWGVLLMIFLLRGFLSFGYSPVRAQILTYFFFALTLFLLETSRQPQRWGRLAWLVPLQILWCNCHGGFLAGLGLIALYAVGEALAGREYRPYLLALGLAGLATLINPYGIRYWYFIAEAAAMPRPEIGEWSSLWAALHHGDYPFMVYYFAGVSFLAAVLIWATGWRDLTAGLALAVTWYLGAKHLRHQVFFYLLLIAYLAAPLSAYLRKLADLGPLAFIRRRLDRRVLLAGYLVVLSFYAFKAVASNPLSLRLLQAPGGRGEIYYPVGAVSYLKEHQLAGKLLTDFDWGEYLLWELHPRCLIAIDGRYETVYPETVVRPYMDFIYARPGWQNFLSQYPPDLILLPKDSKIYQLIRISPAWRQVYGDEGSGLFIRREAAPDPG